MFGKKALATCVLGSAAVLEAAPLYTNTWSNTEGVGVVKNWSDAANWSVAYGGETPAPASSVPTADSVTKLHSSASITLKDGDAFESGKTYFLANVFDKTLNLTIPTGAMLSLVGTSETSYMGTDGWRDSGVNNRTTIDIDGGQMILGQSAFSMRGNTQAAWSRVPLNHIKIRNGGKLAITNGYLRMWGGSSADSQGRGLYTNIIDVCRNSTLEIRNGGRLTMGSGLQSSPWFEQPYYGAGWLNVNGGKIKVVDSTQTASPFVMGTHRAAGVGAYLNVTDGGSVDLGGKSLMLMSVGTNIIAVTTGGAITNGSISSQMGDGTAASYLSLVEINTGKVYVDKLGFSEHSGGSGQDTTRLTVRIHGGDSILDLAYWNIYSTYTSNKTPPCFFDYRLKAHAARTADFEIRPLRTRTAVWDGGHGGGDNAYVHGIYRLSPEGGFQLTHRKTFELVCRKHDSQDNYKFRETYGGLIGEEMWQTNTTYTQEKRWEDYTTYVYAYQFRVTLKDEAKLADGVQLATGVPRAWYQLPKFTERQLDTNRYERVSVRLQLEPQGSATLAGLVSDMNAAGQTAVADDSVAPYNVRVDLPMDELAANVTTDNVVMDFVKVDSYREAVGSVPHVTNALIRAASCEVKKIDRGLVLIVR